MSPRHAMQAPTEGAPSPDGRLARGEARRRLIVEATLRVIDKEGAGAVTQRRVAVEAGVSPASLLYHFTSVEDMLEATLVSVNAAYLAKIEQIKVSGGEPLRAFAEMVCRYGDAARENAVAEFELYRLAMNVPRLKDEAVSWWSAAESLLEPAVPNTIRRRAIVSLGDGLSLRSLVEGHAMDAAETLELFSHLARG